MKTKRKDLTKRVRKQLEWRLNSLINIYFPVSDGEDNEEFDDDEEEDESMDAVSR